MDIRNILKETVIPVMVGILMCTDLSVYAEDTHGDQTIGTTDNPFVIMPGDKAQVTAGYSDFDRLIWAKPYAGIDNPYSLEPNTDNKYTQMQISGGADTPYDYVDASKIYKKGYQDGAATALTPGAANVTIQYVHHVHSHSTSTQTVTTNSASTTAGIPSMGDKDSSGGGCYGSYHSDPIYHDWDETYSWSEGTPCPGTGDCSGDNPGTANCPTGCGYTTHTGTRHHHDLIGYNNYYTTNCGRRNGEITTAIVTVTY